MRKWIGLSIIAAITVAFGGGVYAFTNQFSDTVIIDASLFLREKSAADADVAGDGQLWVRDDVPNVLVFTDDAGTDGALVSGSGTSGTIPRFTSTVTFGDSSIDDDGTDATATGSLTVTEEAVINEGGTDVDTRMEAVGNPNFLYLDAGGSALGVGGTPENGTSDVLTVKNAGAALYTRVFFDNYAANNSRSPQLDFRKSSSSTVDVLSVTSNGEALGRFAGLGVDTDSARQQAARILFNQDGSAGSGYVPGEISLQTDDTTGVPQERIGVRANGLIEITGDLSVAGNSIDLLQSLPVTEVGGGTGAWSIDGGVTVFDAFHVTNGGYLATGATITTVGAGSFKGAILTDEHFNFAEITTPTAVPDYGALYTKTDNALYFQDGAGSEHNVIVKQAYSQLWDNHGADGDTTLDVVMTNADEWYKITDYENIGSEDSNGNATASLTTDDISLASDAGGMFDLAFHGSANVTGGATQELAMAIGIILDVPKAITDATFADPIVVTRVGHGLKNGDMVRISGVVGNTAANTDCIVTNRTTDKFEMVDLSGSTIAGNGVYVSGGTIDIVFPGCSHLHVAISLSDLQPVGVSCRLPIFDSDVVALYVSNQSSAGKTAEFSSLDFGISRVDD